MPRLSDITKVHRAKFRYRGVDIEFEYDSSLLTQEYIDRYEENTKTLNSDVPASKKLIPRRENLVYQVKWIDIQDDDDKDMAPSDFIEKLSWDELDEFDYAIAEDVAKRQHPTPPTGEGSSSG